MSETQNNITELPLNSVGSILTGEILRRASEQAISVINRAEEIEQDLFNLPVRVRNLDWLSLCNEISGIKVAGTHFDKPLCDDQLVLYETLTDENFTRTIVTNTDHKIPLLVESGTIIVTVKNDKQLNPRGLLIEHKTEGNRQNHGLVVFIPFIHGKKTLGLSLVTNNIHRFYYVGNIQTSTIIPNISLNNNLRLRPIRNNLSENDKIIIANTTSRFRAQVEEWSTIKEALEYFNSIIMTQTIDPSYINKLMSLNKQLSFITG